MNGTVIIIVVVIIIAVYMLSKRSNNSLNKIVLAKPTVAFYDLQKGKSKELIEDDKKEISPLFSTTLESNKDTPVCQVLFMYATINKDGKIENTEMSLREIIRDSKSTVVVIATENEGDNYVAAGKDVGYGYANLVMTLKRKGNNFHSFYKELFGLMREGKTMPVAWVKIAPQIPGKEHENVPESIFSCEKGQVSFK